MKLTEKASLFEKMANEALRVKLAQAAPPATPATPAAPAPKLTDAQVAKLKEEAAKIKAQIDASLKGGAVAPAAPVAAPTAALSPAAAQVAPVTASARTKSAQQAPAAKLTDAQVAQLKAQLAAIEAQINASLHAPSPVAPVKASAKSVRFEKSAQAFQQVNELAAKIPHLWTVFTNQMRTPALWAQIPLANRDVVNDQWQRMLPNVDAPMAESLATKLKAFFKAVPQEVARAGAKTGGDLLGALDGLVAASKTIQDSVPSDAPKAPSEPAPIAAPQSAPSAPAAAPKHKGPAQFLTDYMKQQEDSESVDGIRKDYEDKGYIPQQ